MRGTLMLDSDGDLILAEEPGGVQTIGVAFGAMQVAQAANLAVSTKTDQVWWNLAAGIDYAGLFYNATLSDENLAPIRSQAFKQALLSVEGINGFSESKEVTFTRNGRTIAPNLPCVIIDCENSQSVLTPSQIQAG